MISIPLLCIMSFRNRSQVPVRSQSPLTTLLLWVKRNSFFVLVEYEWLCDSTSFVDYYDVIIMNPAEMLSYRGFLPISRGRISAPFPIENSHLFSKTMSLFPNKKKKKTFFFFLLFFFCFFLETTTTYELGIVQSFVNFYQFWC